MKKKILAAFVITGLTVSLFAAEPTSANNQEDSSSQEIVELSDQFLQNLPGNFSIIDKEREGLTLKNGDWMLNDRPLPLVDSFSARTGATASIFVKIENEFVRLSTSLKTEKNIDAFGTTLNRSNPAYEALINGNSYTGQVELFGKTYMAHYDVFRDKEGKIIGAYYIGILQTK